MATSEVGSWIRENSAIERRPLNSHEFSYGLSRLLLGLVLTFGGAIVWHAIVSMSSKWVSDRVQSGLVFESRYAVYRESGEPIVQHSRSQGIYSTPYEYRTFDDEPVTVTDEERLKMGHPTWQIKSFPKSPMLGLNGSIVNWPRRLADAPTPLPWLFRLEDCAIHRRDRYPEHWYFLWPDQPGDSAFLPSYDGRTKSLRGYLGPAGFQTEKPSNENGFPIWDRHTGEIGQLITDPPNYGPPRHANALIALSDERDADLGMLYLTPARDAFYLINLTQQKVELVRAIPSDSLRGFSAKPLDRFVADDPGMAYTQQVLRPRLILRWPNHLEFVTPNLKTLSKVTLPEELRDRSFRLTELKAGGFVGEYWLTQEAIGSVLQEDQFVWFNEDGVVTKHRTVPQPDRPSSLAWRWAVWHEYDELRPSALMPLNLSVLWFYSEAGSILDDDGQVIGDSGEPTTWSIRWTALATLIRRFPWSFGVCLLSGVPFAIACWRRLRRCGASRFERLAWTGLVYLFGLVGWIAFVAHRIGGASHTDATCNPKR